MKVAKFKNIEFGFETVGAEIREEASGYIRISEYVEVEFPPLPHEVVVAEQIAQLGDEKEKVQAETEKKLNDLDRRISELLALPAPSDPAGNQKEY